MTEVAMPSSRGRVRWAFNEGGHGLTVSVYRDWAIRVYLAGWVFWPWGRP